MLDEILENKADTKMVNDLNRIKANYSDLAVTNSYIENLNERLKQVTIMQQEFVKTLKPMHDTVG